MNITHIYYCITLYTHLLLYNIYIYIIDEICAYFYKNIKFIKINQLYLHSVHFFFFTFSRSGKFIFIPINNLLTFYRLFFLYFFELNKL